MNDPEHGVFDELPRRRPAIRSGRRDRQGTARRSWNAPAATGREVEEAAEFAPAATTQGQVPLPPAGRLPPRQAEEAEGASGVRDRFEDLLLAGVGAAADVVVLGVKLAGRVIPGGHGRDRH